MHSINNASGRMANNNPLIPHVPFHQGPVYRPLPKPIRYDTSIQHDSQSSSSMEDINPNINFDFEENSPFQEGVMSKTFQRLDRSFFQEPKELGDLINKGNLIQKYLPKQADIDKILKVIHRQILRGTHLSVEIKKIQGCISTEFLFSEHIYIYLHKVAIRKVEALAGKYILLDSLLFKITPEKEDGSPCNSRNVCR